MVKTSTREAVDTSVLYAQIHPTMLVAIAKGCIHERAFTQAQDVINYLRRERLELENVDKLQEQLTDNLLETRRT